jgi:2'-5' RNA ligase
MFKARPTSVTRSVAIIPPLELWERIQRFRILHEHKSVKRWPPHINLLYPFVQDVTDYELEQLNAAIQKFGAQSLDICLRKVQVFRHAQSVTLVLIPEDECRMELKRLWDILVENFPECSILQYSEFNPHLSIGNFKSEDVLESVLESAKEAFDRDRLCWKMSTICVLGRRDRNDVLGESPFSMTAKIRFENGNSMPFNLHNDCSNLALDAFSNDNIPCAYELDSELFESLNQVIHPKESSRMVDCRSFSKDYSFWIPETNASSEEEIDNISVLSWNVLSENIVKNELDSFNFSSFDER